MKVTVAQYVADWIATVNPRVYGVTGSHAMYLNDAICNHPDLTFTATHHEQAATFAAEADARISGLPGIVHVTAGPGVTNTVTGLSTAWVDSIPLIVIAGQVKRSTMAVGDIVNGCQRHGVRSYGISELPSIQIVKPITKYAVTVFEPAMIRYHLEMAYARATSGRPGPVFVEIPLDVQNTEISVENYAPIDQRANNLREVVRLKDRDVEQALRMISQAKRPVLIIGNGVRLADGCERVNALIYTLGMPVVSGFSGADIVDNNHPKYIGRCGLHGDRASNFAVQNADLILAIGTRLSLPQIGHDPELFAPNAYKIVVDIDYMEATKQGLHIDLPIAADASDFMFAVIRAAPSLGPFDDWLAQCQAWKEQYPVMLPEYRESENGVNPYHFVEELTKHLDEDAIIVTDVGFSYLTPFQSMRLNGKQRLIFASGVGPMGWGLPAAIGACRAGGGRQVVLIAGDGGLMFNLQELQTVAHHKLPIAIFVLENGAYRTMQITQQAHFKREAAASEDSGVSCPNFGMFYYPFGIASNAWQEIYDGPLSDTLNIAKSSPTLITVLIDPSAVLSPRVATRTENGKFLPAEISDMWPYLDREEYARNMSVGAQKRSDAA